MLKKNSSLTILFFIISLFFSKCNSSHDGLDKIGFPLTFYQHSGGKCYHCEDVNFLKADYLLFNIIGYILFAYIISVVTCFIKSKK